MLLRFALLDFDGIVIRWCNYPAVGTVEIKQPKRTYDDLLEICEECLI